MAQLWACEWYLNVVVTTTTRGTVVPLWNLDCMQAGRTIYCTILNTGQKHFPIKINWMFLIQMFITLLKSYTPYMLQNSSINKPRWFRVNNIKLVIEAMEYNILEGVCRGSRWMACKVVDRAYRENSIEGQGKEATEEGGTEVEGIGTNG